MSCPWAVAAADQTWEAVVDQVGAAVVAAVGLVALALQPPPQVEVAVAAPLPPLPQAALPL